VALRTRFAPVPLFRTYERIARDGRFLLLALATGFKLRRVLPLHQLGAEIRRENLLGPRNARLSVVLRAVHRGHDDGAALSNRLAGKLARARPSSSATRSWRARWC
jgi:hypothetical protein